MAGGFRILTQINQSTLKDYSGAGSIDSKNTTVSTPIRHVDSPNKVIENRRVGTATKHKGPVATITNQLMGYVTVKNIVIETSYQQTDWAAFVLKELEDNAYDSLNDYYPAKKPEDKEIRKIGVRIWITVEGINNKFVHIAVQNSNVDNIPVFLDLDKTFDYHNWYSTKRNQHRMTCGSLGDALKRCLGMGYASWTSDYKADETFEDKQWDEPIIIRCNGCEYKAFIKVDTSIEDIWTEILQENKPTRDIGNDTEVEVTLPVVQERSWSGETGNWYTRLQRYYHTFKIGKSRTAFDIYCDPEQLQQEEGI